MRNDLLLRAQQLVEEAVAPRLCGRVVRVVGLMVEAHVPEARIGDLAKIDRDDGTQIDAEVVGFRQDLAMLVPLDHMRGVAPSARVSLAKGGAEIKVGPELIGRVVDAFGRPLDGKPAPPLRGSAPLMARAVNAFDRAPVSKPLETGVRAIDGLLTFGIGQRVGLFAGSGVGKTVLMTQVARQTKADMVVMGLIGERGREVREILTDEGRKNTIIVAATSDRSPMERARGALAATAIAEWFRDQGKTVLLVMDSLTRYAMALREIGLAAGEPPATKGYPPSVFAALPRLLERAAPLSSGGSITGIYTVLVEGDDLADPIADTARSLLDGHVVLSRDLAGRGFFPAVDVLASASRVADAVMSAEHLKLSQRARATLARRRDVEDLRALGAYQPGASAENDEALAIGEKLDRVLRQEPAEATTLAETVVRIKEALTPGPVPAARRTVGTQGAAPFPPAGNGGRR
ncbi:MAG: FliI/YscN family ATPase [Deltaproteobacteria bacterium]|nr:FliI/YscN family ATPase [Deltaproteobacteria bacterium]